MQKSISINQMKMRLEQKSDDQIFPITNSGQPDNNHAMGRTGECEIITGPDEKLARLVEIMQADHDASQLEQYLLEFELKLN